MARSAVQVRNEHDGKGARVAILAGMDFVNMVFVRGLVRSLHADRHILVLTSANAACTVAAETAVKYRIRTERISRCKPHHIIPKCKVLLLLYDGVNHGTLLDFANYAMRHAPDCTIRVFGPGGPIENGIDFLRRSRATFRRGYGGFGNDGVGCDSSE